MAITPLPTPPSRDDPANFATRADAFLGALPDFATEANDLAVDVNDDAVVAAASASTASAAANAAVATANATQWVSGTTYAIGNVVWSPINALSYRRITSGAGTTDPSADPTNWTQIVGTGDVSQTGTQTLSNKTFRNAKEFLTIAAVAATGTINYDVATQSVLVYAINASGNFTINIRGSSSETLNSLMAIGESYTVAFLNTNGGTAFFNNVVQVDGATAGVTTRWQGGAAPTAGNANSIDSYVYTVIKTANAVFTVLVSQTRFA
jgi:hypothetical protein